MALTEKVMVASQGLSPQREPQTDQTMAHSSPHIHPLTWLVTWRQRCKQIFACTPIPHVYPDPCLSTHDPTCTPHTNTHPHPCLCTPLSTCVHISHAPACGSPEASLLGARGLDRGAATLPRQLPVCHWPGLVHSHPWDVCAGQRLYPVTREVPVANRESSNLQLTPKMNLTTTNRLLSRDPPAQKDSTTPPRASLSSAPPHIRVLQSW